MIGLEEQSGSKPAGIPGGESLQLIISLTRIFNQCKRKIRVG
jgi:hypothetical protein